MPRKWKGKMDYNTTWKWSLHNFSLKYQNSCTLSSRQATERKLSTRGYHLDIYHQILRTSIQNMHGSQKQELTVIRSWEWKD